MDKHRQVGNAVAPPMGKAIGVEIRKCVAEVEKAKREAAAAKTDIVNESSTEANEDVKPEKKMEEEEAKASFPGCSTYSK